MPEKSSGLWVFVEQKDGLPARVSLELLGKGHELAEKLNTDVTAILIGNEVTGSADDLIANGADRVIIADHPVAGDYRTEVYTDIIAAQAVREHPEILLFGATVIGRDLAPRVSARLNTGCTADCTGLEIVPETRLLVASKPFFGRDVMTDIICPRKRPQIATVRPGVMELPAPDKGKKGEFVYADLELDEKDVQVKVLENVRSTTRGTALEDAEKVVVGGMGMGDAEGFGMLMELADLLDAEVGATSLPVDASWISHDHLIGQTGKTIRPRLYIGCGISGAIQHSAGMINSEIIIAINSDVQAGIFDFADYGIVGDVNDIVPAIIEELKKRSGQGSRINKIE